MSVLPEDDPVSLVDQLRDDRVLSSSPNLKILTTFNIASEMTVSSPVVQI